MENYKKATLPILKLRLKLTKKKYSDHLIYLYNIKNRDFIQNAFKITFSFKDKKPGVSKSNISLIVIVCAKIT